MVQRVLGKISPWTRCWALATEDLGQRKLVYRVILSHIVAATNVSGPDMDVHSYLLR